MIYEQVRRGGYLPKAPIPPDLWALAPTILADLNTHRQDEIYRWSDQDQAVLVL
jgi:hypothetical protein